mmetsp:Transcript_60707/g.141990  ORF Transcript_60707/g.141990 Transcript_60707/m.141990 type:complete len:495 (-) Transcript_60707:70-1554(-)
MELLKAPELFNEESFVLCDVATKGFPILHASPGFQKLYGLSHAECAASSCGKVVGAESILKDPLALQAAGLEIGGASAGVALVQDVMADFVEDVVHGREADFPSILAINRKSTGQLFTCQMSLMRKHHPELGWSYMVGLQQDISGQVPVSELLKTASLGRESFMALCKRHANRSRLVERLQTKEAEAHFHRVMRDAWRDAISRQMSEATNDKKLQKSRSVEEQTIASVSTACTLSSVVSKKEKDKDAFFHLGAIAKSSAAREPSQTDDPATCDVSSERFMDLLEVYEEDEIGSGTAPAVPNLTCPELESLNIPIFIASPKEDSPIVLCSHTFAKMLGYELAEIPRSSLWSILRTPDVADQVEQADLQQALDDQDQMREFWASSETGEFYKETKASTSNMRYDCKPQGELFMVGDFVGRRDRGLRAAVYMKQVELDDDMYVACVAQPWPHMTAWKATLEMLHDNLDEAITVLAAEFFYSAPMRRQTAVGEETGTC